MITFKDFCESMVAGDAGGDPQKIASGETSGSITGKGAEVLGKGVKRKKKPQNVTEDVNEGLLEFVVGSANVDPQFVQRGKIHGE